MRDGEFVLPDGLKSNGDDWLMVMSRRLGRLGEGFANATVLLLHGLLVVVRKLSDVAFGLWRERPCSSHVIDRFVGGTVRC